MAKNIIWYCLEDGSYGGCAADDLLVCDADDITAEEDHALYESSQSGSDEEVKAAFLAIYNRQHNIK